MGKVSIVRTEAGVKPALIRALELLGGLEKFVGHGDRVMLKPNLNGEEGLTSVELTEAFVQLLRDFRVRKLVIAESTFGNERVTEACFRKSGYAALAEKYGLRLLNLNESEVAETVVRHPLVLDRLKLAREVFETDAIINLPVMKVHYATGVTLALKNLKGLLVGDEKRRFHEVGLDRAIVDLNNTVRPRLNVVDGITGMEKMGPRGGDPVRLDLLVAGADPAEVDCVGIGIMGYDLSEVRHLQLFVKNSGMNPAAVEVTGEKVGDVRRPFRKVEMAKILPPAFRIHDQAACSACMNALLLSCRFLEEESKRNVDVYLGGKIDAAALSGELKIAFGNCCASKRRLDINVRGCPPYPFDLKKALENK